MIRELKSKFGFWGQFGSLHFTVHIWPALHRGWYINQTVEKFSRKLERIIREKGIK